MKIYLILLSIQSSTAYLLDETENLEDGGNFVNGWKQLFHFQNIFLWIRNFLETKYSGVEVLRDFSPPLWLKKVKYIYILDMLEKYLDRTGLFDHIHPISIVQNQLRLPLLGFEVRDDVIFSQSGHDCPVILCPVIPHPNCIRFQGSVHVRNKLILL